MSYQLSQDKLCSSKCSLDDCFLVRYLPPSIYLSISVYVSLSIYLFCAFLLPFFLSINLSIHPSLYQSVSLYIYLISIFPRVHPPTLLNDLCKKFSVFDYLLVDILKMILHFLVARNTRDFGGSYFQETPLMGQQFFVHPKP